MKDTSTTPSVAANGSCRGVERARVDAVDDRDPLVLAQSLVQLTPTDVDRAHLAGAGLQQAVREAAGRGPHVETALAGGIDAEGRERGRELLAAPDTNGGPGSTARRASGLTFEPAFVTT